MISALLRPLACAFALTLALASSARAAPPELGDVLKQLSDIAALSLRFREEKQMALLAAPLSSEGALHYQKPRLLVRHTERPRKGSVLLRGDTLSFGNAKQAQSMALSSQPALRVLVDTFVSVLGGDREALERVATVTLEPQPEGAYRIHVTPKDDKVKRLVQSMSFDGKGALLTRMELRDASGDTTVTTFHDVVVRKPFSEAERTRLFRIAK